jgi:hypothetical protein
VERSRGAPGGEQPPTPRRLFDSGLPSRLLKKSAEGALVFMFIP